MENFFYEERGTVLEEVTADSGYCSEKNLLYLKEQNIFSYIKLQDHEKRKTRAYQEDIGKYYNVKTQKFEDELYYVCHDGRELHHLRTETKEQAGYLVLEEVTADSGYCSEKNLLYLKEQNISSYIKLQDHEKRKTRAYLEDIGKYYNMKTQMFEDELYYVCHDGRELHHIRTETKEQAGYLQMFEVYECSDCSGCEHKAKRDLKEKSKKRLLRKRGLSKIQSMDFYALKYIQKRKIRISRRSSKY